MGEEKAILKHLRFVVLFSGITGCIQSIGFTCLSITGIVLISESESEESLSNTFGGLMRAVYLSGSPGRDELLKDLLSPNDLLIWLCVMLSLMVLWLLSSILLMGGVKEEPDSQASLYLTLWASLTIAVCILDLALGTLFGIDITKLLDMDFTVTPPPDPLSKIDTLSADILSLSVYLSFVPGVMMTLALKGYILWILNFACAIYFLVATAELVESEDDQPPHDMNHHAKPINAFDPAIEQRSSTWLNESSTAERPRLHSNYGGSPYGGQTNPAYVTSLDNPRMQQQQPLASIIKKSVDQRNEQQNHRNNMNNNNRNREPNTPSPDYSPPMRNRPFRQSSEVSNQYHNPSFNSNNNNYNNYNNNQQYRR